MQGKRIFSRVRYFCLLAALVCLTNACNKKEQTEKKSSTPPPPPPVESTPVAETPKEKPLYVYSGDRFRDPFTPSGQSTNYQPDAVFDPQRATVKGIIFGRYSKSAVLNVGGSGSYFVKADNLFDVMGKKVEGYTAKVYVDKVMIMGDSDNVFELKIKNSEEEGKPL